MPDPPGGPVIGKPRATPRQIELIQERKVASAGGAEVARWVTMADDKVCPPCRHMHGRIVRVDNVPYVCLGTCRCTLVSVYKPPVAPPDAWGRYWEQRLLELGADLHAWLMQLSDEELRELQHRYETLERWEFEQWWHEEWRRWREGQ